jgi:hypothetical protein
MAEDIRFMLYDTWQPGVTASAQQVLFQVAQGADSTHTESFTNMRGSGSLPSQEKMVVDKISVIVDKALAIADLTKWIYGSILEIRVSDFSRIKGPVAKFIDASAWSGSVIEAAAADTPTVGLVGDGYELDKFIEINGGTPFKVLLTQNLALSAATNIKVVLEGIYTVASVQ